MRSTLSRLRFPLYFLLLLAMTACGANHSLGTGNNADGSSGKIVGSLVLGKNSAKTLAFASFSSASSIASIQSTVTGSDASGNALPVVRSTTSTAGNSVTVGGIYPGNVTLTVKALDSNGVVLYEGFAIGVPVIAGQVSNAGTIAMTAPFVKTQDASCIACHETTLDVDGQNLVANFKQSGHYTNLAWTDAPKDGITGTGCAGCHGPQHNTVDPSSAGRCWECHGANFSVQHTDLGGVTTNCTACHEPHNPNTLIPNLLISRTVYAGYSSSVTVGQALPGGGFAIASGKFPNVFKNESPDPSFGVTSPIFLDQLSLNGAQVKTIAVDPNLLTSSFASKSELALNVSADGTAVTFMGYKAGINQLDVSNSNTPAVFDATNPVPSTSQRAVAQVDLKSGTVSAIGVNAYSGNNGRAAVLANGMYYMVGNAGNGSGDANTLSALSDNTGVQAISAGAPGNGATTAIGLQLGTYGSSTGYQRGFSLAQLPDPANPGKFYAADKTGKDDNFRGMTVFDNTLYVTKGSGSNGVNTVYQVGAAGALANGASIPTNAAITVLPGFNALSEKVAEAKSTLTATPHPFGIWFADANTLFVADEGDGVRLGVAGKVTTFAGLGEYKLVNGVWNKVANFQGGLLDQPTYTAGLAWNIKTDGLRNLTG